MSKNINSFEIYRDAAKVSLSSGHFYHLFILGLLLLYCTAFYYFREILTLFRLEALELDFLYKSHTVQQMSFLVPIAFASCVFSWRGAFLSTLVSIMIVLARFLIVPASFEPLINLVHFTIAAIIVSTTLTLICKKLHRQRYGHS